MILNAKLIVDLVIKYDLDSVEEFLLAYCVYKKDYPTLKKYMDHKSFIFNNEIIENLVKKGIIDCNKLNTDKIEFLDLYVTEEFSNQIFIDTLEAGEELYSVYPDTTTIQGGTVILKKGDKIGNFYWGKDELMELYCKKIDNDRSLHNQIIECIKRCKEKGIINFTLRSFIFDSSWESLMKLDMKKDYTSTISI